MLLDHASGDVVQMTIVKIVGVTVVLDGGVTTGRPMLMIVVFVIGRHRSFPC